MTIDLRLAFPLATYLLLAACGSAPKPVFDPKLEEERAKQEKLNENRRLRQEAFKTILNDMDRVLDRYAQALLNSGAPKSDKLAHKLENHIRSYVGPDDYVYFNEFMRTANETSVPRNRAIALATIGFSDRREALDPLLNALGDENPEIVSNAVFGLGILRDSNTPPSYLARVMKDASHNELLRGSAAWSLYRVQSAAVDTSKFGPIWSELLSAPLGEVDAGVAVSALRGLGALRTAADASVVERYVSHPSPKVRQTAAVALGRIGVADSHTALLALIGTAESNPNVRLAARKALQALAGGVDRGYDVGEWQQVFDRG